jgi:hypothetical protein
LTFNNEFRVPCLARSHDADTRILVGGVVESRAEACARFHSDRVSGMNQRSSAARRQCNTVFSVFNLLGNAD